jgi:hypothetical protein
MLTYLLIGIRIDKTKVARATYVRTIGTVVAPMALAKPIRAVALAVAVVRAVVYSQPPHIF